MVVVVRAAGCGRTLVGSAGGIQVDAIAAVALAAALVHQALPSQLRAVVAVHAVSGAPALAF